MASKINRLIATVFSFSAILIASCAPPPVPQMSAYLPSEAVEICAGGVCGKAGEKFALNDIAKATAAMVKANGPGIMDICPADRDSKQCTGDRLSYTVHGVISATGTVPQGELRAGATYDGERKVRLRLNIPTIIFGEASICDDARSHFTVRSAQKIVWLSTPYKCSWGGGPKNINAEGRLGIDFIDFDRGVWGGDYTIRVTEGGNGYGTGYALARFSTGMEEAKTTWIRPKTARPVIAEVPKATFQPLPIAQPPVTTNSVQGLGNYYALVIGNNNYQHIRPLKTAVSDAQSVANIMQNRFGFKVELLLNADRNGILTAFEKLRYTLTPQDNLLIYYAGHGWLDSESDEGYWFPVNARQESQIQWISNSTVTGLLRAIQAKHIMVIADSCYSGKLSRGLHITAKTPDYFQRIAKKRARVVLSSGGLEPVLDSGGGSNHSVFTGALLKTLNEVKGITDGATIFSQLRRLVMLSADQVPEYADIRKAGHDGGDFLFVPK
ncbi:MAG: caspase family protein [Magnetococcales bacterium]|nr:caspase family protein [Magnetococcales bacterium]